MGVVTVHQYPVGEGKSGQQTVESLVRTLELLGGRKIGNFLVDCETYYSASNISPPRSLNIIHNLDQPATCFALLDTGTCISVDTNFDLLMLTMGSLYQCKKSSKMECKGPKLQLGDFTVKIGTVTIGPSFKGILIEVEYGPCSVPNYCWNLMKEFMASFLPFQVEPHPQIQAKMNDLVSPIETTQQYNDQFNQLRKASVNPTSSIVSSSSLTTNQSNQTTSSSAATVASSPSTHSPLTTANVQKANA